MGAANNPPRLEVPVSGGRLLGVEGTHPDARLEEPLYAINLLSCRRPWAYNLYSVLGYPGVRRVGGRLLFKGHRCRVLRGAAAEVRDTLLIVRYPHGASFLDMARRPYFGAISLLRRIGISGFQFGFAVGTELTGAAPEAGARPTPYQDGKAFLLWGVGGSESHDPDLFEPLRRLCATDPEIDLVFSGQLTARLTVRHKEATSTGATRLAPPLPWEGVALLAAVDEKTLEEFVPVASASLPPRATQQSMLVFYDRQY